MFLFFVNQELSVGDVHCSLSGDKYDYQLQLVGSLNTTCHQHAGEFICSIVVNMVQLVSICLLLKWTHNIHHTKWWSCLSVLGDVHFGQATRGINLSEPP